MSLPAVLVAAIALSDGPGTGLAFGFAAGLVADLGSAHPAGVLALCWLGIGLVCGVGAAAHTTVRRDAFVAAVVCGCGAFLVTVALSALGADGASVGAAVRGVIPAALGDGLLASVVVPVVRLFLRADALRAPQRVLVLSASSASSASSTR